DPGDVALGETSTALATRPEIGEALRALPGVKNVNEVGSGSFTFSVEQPIDHMQPAVGTFDLRVQLRHRSETAPTVLSSSGYSLFSAAPSDSEPSYMLNANAITVEQRFFSASTPMAGPDGEPPPEAWQYMTVKQAADDTHHVIELLKQIYTGPWISTGASKGGQVAVYHYRHHPSDLVGVVAYVAPHSYGSNDPRFVTFLEHVGDASCREKLIALQRDVLMRRSETFPRFQQQASAMGLTFEAIGIEAAFEHVVQEFRVAFWQYGNLSDCSSLPQPGASATSALSAITAAVPVNLGADQTIRSVRSFETYYYQAAVEYGQYGPLEEHLEDLLQHRGTYTMEKYAPQVPSLKFVPETGIDIGNWVKNEAEHIIFVYGEIDPWTAGAFEIDPTRDMHAFIVPGASHGANLAARSLPAESRALALEVLERWTGVKPRSLTAESQELYFHAPAQPMRF
ncbi:MAG TPA: S28 family serine protease, partial [Polyangiales bacterium]|nr:S28 family serine protease [Polyangiales bacterium]